VWFKQDKATADESNTAIQAENPSVISLFPSAIITRTKPEQPTWPIVAVAKLLI